GLRLVEQIEDDGTLAGYHLLPATRADLLRRLGRSREAAAAYRRALELAGTDAERRYLAKRLAEISAARQQIRTEWPSGPAPFVLQVDAGTRPAEREDPADDRSRPRHPARNRAAAWPRYFGWGAHLAADLGGVLHGDPRRAGGGHRAAVHPP